jgi:hypothetical protein
MRLADWQLRLAEFVKARAPMPFVWGENDCCLFVADAIEAMTGADPAAPVRGYDSALGAHRLIEGAGGLRELVSQLLGEPVSPLMAGVGDAVLLDNEGRELLAICNGTSAIGPSESGLAVLSMEAARVAWKV